MAKNDKLEKHRILFLFEPITREVASELISQLVLLDADDHGSDIDLWINSPGGSVVSGLAIIDAIQCIEAPVRTTCIGQAASMASWILAAGKPGERSATPNAEVMIHQVIGGFSGSSATVEVYANNLLETQGRMIQMFSRFTGRTQAQIREDIRVDKFMTALAAKEYGIVDRILVPFHAVGEGPGGAPAL